MHYYIYMQVQLAETGEQLSRAQEGTEDVRRQCTQRLHDVQSRVQSVRALQQAELDKERQQLRVYQREVEQKMVDLEGNLACQRDEITTHFEQILREREHEYETRTKDIRSAHASSEDKLRVAVREVEACKSAMASLKEESRSRAEDLVRVEKEVREKQWALEDQGSLQDGVIRDLEKRLSQTEAKLGKQAEEFVKRSVLTVICMAVQRKPLQVLYCCVLVKPVGFT